LFKSREHFAGGNGVREACPPASAAPAWLSLSQALPAPAVIQAPTQVRRSTRSGWVPDLAEDIGSLGWFRGLATMIGLAGIALFFWPSFSAVEAAPTMRLDTSMRDEFRSRMIMPLGLGADTGGRMGATAAIVPLAAAPERPSVQLTATLGQGDSFPRMLQRAGVGDDDTTRIAALVADTVPLREIAPGTRFDLTLGRRSSPTRPRPVEDLAFRARFDLELAIERRGGALALVRKPIEVDSTPLRIQGIVGSSLYRSARAAGAPAKAIQQYLRTLDAHLSLERDVLPSDTFDIVIAYKRAAGGEVEAGDLLYAGIERDGAPRAQLLKWGGATEGAGQFFEASGVGERQQGFGTPVAGRVTSGFGMRRHPILGYTRMHAGVDFRAAYGLPIYASGNGIVEFAGRHGGHGNYVRLAHGGGIGTGYGHMSRIAVSPGMRVRQGQVIGYVGSTGLSTGPHLHYELYKDGRAVNPASVAFVARAQLEGSDLAAFRARLAELRAIRPGAALTGVVPGGARLPARSPAD
jgi:murein DD-endopeptidase MepM/ murein hydrolase activator NlpD